MDPIGENENPSVDTNLKEEQSEQVNQNTPLNEIQEEEQHEVKEEEQKEQISSTTEKEDTKVDSSVQEHREEEKPQPDQEPLADAAPEDKDNQKDKESGKEKESLPQSKHWKNRKKKHKDEQIGDVAQWPTPNEARHSKGQPPKKPQVEAGRNPSKSERDRDNKYANRGRRGINWMPLSELPKTQGTGDQSSAASGSTSTSSSAAGEGERVGTASASSSERSGRSYQSSYGRGQSRRRGSGRSQNSPWPRSSNVAGAQQFSQDGTSTPSESGAPVAQETETKEETTQVAQDSASSQASGNQTTNPQESRRYRGSSRGTSSRGSNRFGRGGYFSRATYYRHPNTRGPPISPTRPPQDPEQLREVTKKQIEYYFGVDNLCKDIFLRKNMNNEGWISIHLILNFNRVRDLNIDAQRFLDALKDSQVVETKDEFIRRRDDWARWTFPPRIESSQTTATKPVEVAQPTEQSS